MKECAFYPQNRINMLLQYLFLELAVAMAIL